MLDMAPGTSTMLRARRKDINVKPNRRLDRKSSRGMLYENEELRLRTININAEVEKGQSDIKKLRRENEHLRREIWGLRDEYDRLEGLLKKRRGQDSENEEEEYDREDDEEDEDDEEEDADEEDEDRRDQENEENAQKATTATSGSSSILGGHRDTSRRNSLRVEFDGLSVVDEEADETQTVSEHSPGYQQETDQDGGPYCGTITLPNGRQGVFFSDAMAAPRRKVNGAGPNISFSEYQALLASHNVDPGDMQFPQGDPPEGYTYPYYENTGAIGLGTLVSTAPPPPPDDSDYFHSIARAGPDLFITGAYPVSKSPAEAMFPTGGNLDQLLREVHSQELAAEQDAEGGDLETRVVVEPDHVCAGQVKEVIDALETQLGDAGLRGGVRGVRAQSGECYICLSRQQEAQSLLRSGLGLRGHQLTLLDVSRDSLVVCLSGVPHHVTDTAVALLAASFGTVIGEVERRLYKGVDTGERLLRVKPNPGVDQLPPAVSLAGSKVKLRVLPPEEVAALGHAGDLPLTTSPEPPTSSTQYGDDNRACSSSSDNSLNGDSRFKSHLNVRLKQPDTASTPNILPNTASLAPSQPPFFSTLPSTRKGPQWPTMDAEHQQVPRNPFSADYQATLPSNARLSSSDSSALAGNVNPFTYPAHPNFDPEYVLPSPGLNPSGGRIPHQIISGQVPPPVIAPGTPLTHRPTPAPSYLNPNAVLISPTHKNLTVEKQLDALSPQSNSTPSSPINSRQQRLSKKAGGPPHTRSFDETMPSSASPLLGRRVNISSPITTHKKERMSRKTSGNSVSSQPSADDGEALPPSLTASTPTSQKKNSRKISVNVSEVHPQSNADASRCSSSSGQESPTKSDRRRRVSVYFNKKGGGRRDSNVVGNGTRSLSASRYGPGEGGEATTSDRERTNSVSSRTSSATGGGRRKLSKSSNRALDVGDNKVPWCGCWGNGCI